MFGLIKIYNEAPFLNMMLCISIFLPNRVWCCRQSSEDKGSLTIEVNNETIVLVKSPANTRSKVQTVLCQPKPIRTSNDNGWEGFLYGFSSSGVCCLFLCIESFEGCCWRRFVGFCRSNADRWCVMNNFFLFVVLSIDAWSEFKFHSGTINTSLYLFLWIQHHSS